MLARRTIDGLRRLASLRTFANLGIIESISQFVNRSNNQKATQSIDNKLIETNFRPTSDHLLVLPLVCLSAGIGQAAIPCTSHLSVDHSPI